MTENSSPITHKVIGYDKVQFGDMWQFNFLVERPDGSKYIVNAPNLVQLGPVTEEELVKQYTDTIEEAANS